MAREPRVIEPANGQVADAALILLHGLGADGSDFEPLVPALGLPRELALRVVLPHAPVRAVTVNGGMRMPAWYDILEMDLLRKIDVEQLEASAATVQALIDAQREAGIDSRRIVIAGFSQGGAVAYQAALTYPHRLAGLLAMSTYFATGDTLDVAEANRDLAVEVHHGTFDPIVPESLGRVGYERVRELGLPAHYRSYPMAHALCPQQIADIGGWLKRRLPTA
ncbi:MULTISPECIES: alpha/beta fold hydrolase [unclassified Modicisalibacter]|uniref:alpha/beta hydrolase n=1 Tax=unclassified Modicisalibacter TaxID=2679913 RepID=UPI001CCE68A2|nr:MULTISPECIES: alpha/beta fold hydrolase [unclassified Modicisalibacter]MBZ9557722.1 alpha/beta fold hydrolase [Modicisalibacter sp. R2A 31.J]MBZ9573614.1 alpha/beta fold hydrolase [Modicisalibacter sp. MOD 31.J]